MIIQKFTLAVGIIEGGEGGPMYIYRKECRSNKPWYLTFLCLSVPLSLPPPEKPCFCEAPPALLPPTPWSAAPSRPRPSDLLLRNLPGA